MLRKTNILTLLLAAVVITGCNAIPESEYYTRGQPESLLNLSRETVFLNIGPDTAEELSEWLDENQPTSAEISCASRSIDCDDTADIIEQYGIDYSIVENGDDSVLLVYENISANDCDNRFISDHNNPYHLNRKGFGCSIASNMLNMVADKRQFTNPLVIDGQNAVPASNVYNSYITRTPAVEVTGASLDSGN